MKLFSLLLFCFSVTVHAQSVVLKMQGNSAAQFEPLLEAGFRPLDAHAFKHDQHWHLRWFPGNGSVAFSGDAAWLSGLNGRDLEFEFIQPAVKPTLPAADKLLPDQFGWPKTMTGWPTIYGQAVNVCDINHNGSPEIFLSNSEGYSYMWKPNGTFVPGFPKNPVRRFVGVDPSTGDSVFTTWVSTGSRENSAAGDFTGDGLSEFIFGKDIGMIFAHAPYSQPLPGLPKELPFLTFSNDPAMADINNDGSDELIIVTYLDDYYYPNAPAYLHVYGSDGSDLPGWPVELGVQSESSPSVGDIDGDGDFEIIVGTGKNSDQNIGGKLFAFNSDGSICSGFPIEIGYAVNSTASLFDIDQNGVLDILIRVKPENKGVNGIYAYDGAGLVLPGFPAVLTSGGTSGAPAIADMDGDGLPEIAIGTVEAVDLGKVWVFEHNGSLKANFPQPVYATWVEESVILADVSGDSLPDVICGTNGVVGDPAKLWAFDHTGAVVSGFPVTINETFSSLESTPTAADIDHDGDIEIFSASHEGTVYCWDTPGKKNTNNAWPTYKFNPRRSGSKITTANTLENPEAVQPNQIIFYPNYPNPFNPQTVFTVFLPHISDVTLRIFDITGRLVNTLHSAQHSKGLLKLNWSPSDNGLAGGIYFAQIEVKQSGAAPLHKFQKVIYMK